MNMNAWSCKARNAPGNPEPQDCDWPHCDCDPAANRVMGALQEEGLTLIRDWQPIATAPKDGTPFLCGFWDRTKSDYFWITKAHWANGAVDGGWDGAREPIELVKAGYWMPLPSPPPTGVKP